MNMHNQERTGAANQNSLLDFSMPQNTPVDMRTTLTSALRWAGTNFFGQSEASKLWFHARDNLAFWGELRETPVLWKGRKITQLFSANTSILNQGALLQLKYFKAWVHLYVSHISPNRWRFSMSWTNILQTIRLHMVHFPKVAKCRKDISWCKTIKVNKSIENNWARKTKKKKCVFIFMTKNKLRRIRSKTNLNST